MFLSHHFVYLFQDMVIEEYAFVADCFCVWMKLSSFEKKKKVLVNLLKFVLQLQIACEMVYCFLRFIAWTQVSQPYFHYFFIVGGVIQLELISLFSKFL